MDYDRIVDDRDEIAGRSSLMEKLGWIAAWVWTIAAGGGGLWLMWTKGPWPLTNGWFALCSGLAACPVTAWMFNKYAGITDVRPGADCGSGVLLYCGENCFKNGKLI